LRVNKLGKYEIRRTLGKGAMGIVYEGFDPVIERTVAIKTILPSQLTSAEVVGVMARFKREAQAAGRLNHPASSRSTTTARRSRKTSPKMTSR
jgi:eukaryotic-like serine/threonine-protein kinase